MVNKCEPERSVSSAMAKVNLSLSKALTVNLSLMAQTLNLSLSFSQPLDGAVPAA